MYPIDPTTKRIRLADLAINDTWAAMERLVPTGKVRSIGVSNCSVEKVQELLRTASIVPAVDQYEAHPYLQQRRLVGFLKEKVSMHYCYLLLMCGFEEERLIMV